MIPHLFTPITNRNLYSPVFVLLISTIASVQSIHCMKNGYIDISKLSYLPTEQPEDRTLATIRTKLEFAPEKEVLKICSLIKQIDSEKPGQRFGVCFNYAMLCSLPLTLQEFQSLKVIGREDWVGNLKILTYYDQTDTPQAGSLAVYFNSLKKNVIEHLSIVSNNGTIISKFGPEISIYDHPLWCIPEAYGNMVTFWNLKTRYQSQKGKKLLLNLLQQTIAADKDLQELFNEKQRKLFELTKTTVTSLYAETALIKKIDYFLNDIPHININIRDREGQTVLMIASNKGLLKQAKFFVTYKADLNLRNKKGQTALLQAAKNNHTDIVEFLLTCGADPHIKDNKGREPIISPEMLHRTQPKNITNTESNKK